MTSCNNEFYIDHSVVAFILNIMAIEDQRHTRYRGDSDLAFIWFTFAISDHNPDILDRISHYISIELKYNLINGNHILRTIEVEIHRCPLINNGEALSCTLSFYKNQYHSEADFIERVKLLMNLLYFIRDVMLRRKTMTKLSNKDKTEFGVDAEEKIPRLVDTFYYI